MEPHQEKQTTGGHEPPRDDANDTTTAEPAIWVPTNDAAHDPEAHQSKKEAAADNNAAFASRTSPSDPGPPPDGGWLAWVQVLAGHLVVFNCWGQMISFGIFQPYYVSMLDIAPSTVSWIGSIQLCLVYLVGALAGRAFDAGYLKPILLVGCLLQLIGLFMTSICKTYWQLVLAQGVCAGLGFGLTFAPAISHVSTFFSKKKVVAMGVAACGGATGGIVFPLIAQQLLPKVGFGWTVRVMGLVALVNSIIIIATVKTRLPPRKAGPIVDWEAYKELPFVLYNIAVFFIMWALYFGYYYARAYALDALDATQAESFNILMIINVVGIPGRLVPAIIADRYIGAVNVYIPWTLACGVCIFAWYAVRDVTATYIWVSFFGVFGAGLMSLFPAAAASLCKDLSKVGTRIGMVFTLVSVPSLTGAPLAGRLMQDLDGGYLGAQIWGGCCMILGSGFLAAASWASRRDAKREAS